jgi:heme A synthase
LSVASVWAILLEMWIGSGVTLLGPQHRCPGWPLCGGGWWPSMTDIAGLVESGHRMAAGLVSVLVVASAVTVRKTWGSTRIMRQLAGYAVVLLALVIAVGGVGLWLQFPGAITDVQVGLTLALLGVMITMTVFAGAYGNRRIETMEDAGKEREATASFRNNWILPALLYFASVLGGLATHGHTVFSPGKMVFLVASHSMVAVCIAVVAGYGLWNSRSGFRLFSRPAYVLLAGIAAAEGVTGVILVAGVSRAMEILHFMGATLLFACSVYGWANAEWPKIVRRSRSRIKEAGPH